MDLATIVIEPDEARQRVAEYQEALRQERNVEDEAMLAGFRAAARGLPIIQLSKCIERGGFFNNGLPRMAVARADAKEVAVEWEWFQGHGVRFDSDPIPVGAWRDTRRRWQRRAMVGSDHVRVALVKPDATPRVHQLTSGRTIVPSVPPRFRPKRQQRLHGLHVLWEVEKWDPTPPVDPALIRHIRGDLWSVLAVWDLTELERAVLATR